MKKIVWVLAVLASTVSCRSKEEKLRELCDTAWEKIEKTPYVFRTMLEETSTSEFCSGSGFVKGPIKMDPEPPVTCNMERKKWVSDDGSCFLKVTAKNCKAPDLVGTFSTTFTLAAIPQTGELLGVTVDSVLASGNTCNYAWIPVK